MTQVFGSQHIKRKQEDSRDGISNIPTNKTLYINQFTATIPLKPVLVRGLQNLNDIFNYYQPNVEVVLEDYQEAFIKETFSFNNLNDFEPENLIESSEILQQLKRQQLECLELLKAARGNSGFQKIIEEKIKRNAFIATLNEFKKHLDKNTEAQFIEKSLNKKNAAVNVLLANDHEWYRILNASSSSKATPEFQKKLKNKLLAQHYLWKHLFTDIDSIIGFVEKGKKYYKELDARFKKNLLQILKESSFLETTYRGISHFIQNTNKTNIPNLTLLNADIEQCKTLDNPIFLNTVKKEFNDTFDRLDLMEHYSLMVIPGYLGTHTTLEQWAKIASENKVLLLTDFTHLDNPDDVSELFEKANHVRADMPLANVVMTCNWLVARGANRWLGEIEPLYIPPSSALAGKLYSSLLSQACAGTEFGAVAAARGVRFLMSKNDLSTIEQKGLIPMYYNNGSTVAYSAKTLFNGNNLGLQTYSVVRVFDYLSKVLIDYLNQRTFENFNVNVRKQAMEEIIQFLDQHVGANKLISNFSVLRFERDPKHKDQVMLNLNITPYFPAKNFLIRMYGKNDSSNSNWKTDYLVNTN